MACDVENTSSETTEDKAVRVGKTACKKEACAIQICLQGTIARTSINAKYICVIILDNAHQNNT